MEMRGFKQILHLARSIRLKLCNQAHVPLLLKQELFGRFRRRNSPILIIYLKAMFCLFISAVCLFVVIFPHATISLLFTGRLDSGAHFNPGQHD